MSTVFIKSNLQNIAFRRENAYITRAVCYSNISAEEFLDIMSRNSGINKGTLYTTCYEIAKSLKTLVFQGHSVTVPEIGTFRFSVKAKASDTADKAGANNVYHRTINFLPDKAIKKELNSVVLKNIPDI